MIDSIGTDVYQPIQRSFDLRREVTVHQPLQASGNSQQLTPEAQQQVNKLRAIDQKVRLHEQAHISAAGGLGVSGATFQMQRGPDGKNYAVAGEVQIDVSPGKSPEETVEKARRIQAAALAPSDPSSADRAVAAAAAQMEAQAQAEISHQNKPEGSNQKAETAPNQPLPDKDAAKHQRAIAAYQEASANTVDTHFLTLA